MFLFLVSQRDTVLERLAGIGNSSQSKRHISKPNQKPQLPGGEGTNLRTESGDGQLLSPPAPPTRTSIPITTMPPPPAGPSRSWWTELGHTGAPGLQVHESIPKRKLRTAVNVEDVRREVAIKRHLPRHREPPRGRRGRARRPRLHGALRSHRRLRALGQVGRCVCDPDDQHGVIHSAATPSRKTLYLPTRR